jgi:glycosyltransferase involved in cell wall biosynthesis
MALRIGFDITPLSVPRSGVSTYTACLLEQLQQGPDTILPLSHYPLHYRWSEGDQGANAGSAADTENGSDPRESRPKVLNKTLWMQLHLWRQLEQLKPDLCHFTNSVGPISAPCPTILTIHDMTLWLYPSYHPWRRLVAMRPIIPIVARKAEAIITVSHSVKKDIVRILGLPAEKVHVIHEAPGAEFRLLKNAPELDVARRKYGLPEQFILHVGTLEPRKNLVRLLEAFDQLRRTRAIGHELVFVGKRGWKDEAIFAAVERLNLAGAVHFLDFVPGRLLPAIYNLADMLVFPSLHEGFGLPLVEAMACGTPVVASPFGALMEVAANAAVFFDPLDVTSIAEGLQRVLTDRQLHTSLKLQGLERAGQFGWEKTAQKTRQLYWQVATGASSVSLAPNPSASPKKQTGAR